jgi:hypothetical protein
MANATGDDERECWWGRGFLDALVEDHPEYAEPASRLKRFLLKKQADAAVAHAAKEGFDTIHTDSGRTPPK